MPMWSLEFSVACLQVSPNPPGYTVLWRPRVKDRLQEQTAAELSQLIGLPWMCLYHLTVIDLSHC